MTTPGTTSTTPVPATQSASSIAVVVNPASGSAADDEKLREAFDGRSVDWLETSENDPGTGQASRAIAAGTTTVIACGGDGTVSAVLQAIAGTGATLGVVPLGTGNLLASNMSIPSGLDGVPIALDGSVRQLDVGTVNGERFAVMAGIGFDAAMIRDANPTVKHRFGRIAYVFSAVRNVPAKLTRAVIEVDGRRVWSGRTAMVLVGNCTTVSGGLQVFPDGTPDDGVLDVAVLSAKRLRDWASVFSRLARRKPQRPELVARFTGTEVIVRLAAQMPYELDGEARRPTNSLEFGIEPGALAIRCGEPEPQQ